MPLLLFYDTETQTLPLFREPSSDPRQPHLVQVAAKLIDSETRSCHAAIDLIVKPDNWEIPEETVKIHGITTEHANRVGVPEEAALMMLLTLDDVADVRIAYGQPFDTRIIRIAIKRYLDEEMAAAWKSGNADCAMKMARPICNMPRLDGKNGNKNPKLIEAYKHFTGQSMTGAHTAMGDVNGCIAVWFAMMDIKLNENNLYLDVAQPMEAK